jgi:hypothetical protein
MHTIARRLYMGPWKSRSGGSTIRSHVFALQKNTLVTTAWGKIWKQWPLDAEKDGRAILRVDGKLYDRQMIRIVEKPEVKPVLELLSKKYNLARSPNTVVTGYVGLSRLASRKMYEGSLLLKETP